MHFSPELLIGVSALGGLLLSVAKMLAARIERGRLQATSDRKQINEHLEAQDDWLDQRIGQLDAALHAQNERMARVETLLNIPAPLAPPLAKASEPQRPPRGLTNRPA